MPLPSSQGGSDPARPLPPSEPGPAVRQRPAPASTTPETGAVLYLQRRVLGRLTKPFSFYPNHGTGYSAPESDRPGPAHDTDQRPVPGGDRRPCGPPRRGAGGLAAGGPSGDCRAGGGRGE